VNKKFIYFPESFIFNDCMGSPNSEYINSIENSYFLIGFLTGKIITVFVLSNYIFPKCYKTSIYYIPSFNGYIENYTKFSVNFYAGVITNVTSMYYGLFYYKFLIINNKTINFIF